jgi:Class III cytochrome C family
MSDDLHTTGRICVKTGIAFLFAVLIAAAADSPFSVLDLDGARGPVAFPHQLHEGVVNPDPSSPHKAAQGNTCTTCHHTVTSAAGADQYLPCSACHGAVGSNTNPADGAGIELSGREIGHRACIGCHLSTKASTPAVFKNNIAYTRCGECHQPTLRQPAISETPAPVFPISTAPAIQTVSRIPAGDAVPVPDRWDVDPPMRHEGPWYDPYHQNPIKGDIPLRGTNRFLNISAESESFANQRQTTGTYTPTNFGTNLFERANQWAVRQTLLLTFDLSSKGTAFRPAAWRFVFTPAFNYNFLGTQRAGIPFEDVNKGTQRQKVFGTVQSLFAEFRLGDTPKVLPFLHSDTGVNGDSPYFDSTSMRLGIQTFNSDFRGFIFNDTNLGARIFGNAKSNRYQFNLAGFSMLQKDVDSELNTWLTRNQAVIIANLYRQDTFLPGYTMQFSLHYNHDRGGVYTDQNGFVDRPVPAQLDAVYLGWAGDGHLGRLNLTHAFYQALGHDGHNLLANRPLTINAQFGAVEASITEDWIRFRAGFLYASGDKNPYGGSGRGFDAIADIPDFAGGRFGFWNSQLLRLVRTEYNLDSQNSLLPSMRTNKFAGVANFDNPGLYLYNAGFDADIKPKVRFIANWNYLMFDHTQPITAVIGVPNISNKIGLDNGFGLRFRPLLNDNFLIDTGYSFLLTGEGMRQIYGGTEQAGSVLHSVFLRIRVVF